MLLLFCRCMAGGSDDRKLRRQLCMGGSVNSYDMMTWYSVDVSQLLLCHSDEDLLPRVTVLLSELVWGGKRRLLQNMGCESNKGLDQHECTVICTFMYRRMLC